MCVEFVESDDYKFCLLKSSEVRKQHFPKGAKAVSVGRDTSYQQKRTIW